MKVLVVEDSQMYRALLRDVIAGMPFVSEIETAATGAEALSKAVAWRPDVITLDVDLPDITGIRVLRELRAAGSEAAVVMVSALTEAGTGVALLATELGAVDVVAKPRAGRADLGVAELDRQLRPLLAALSQRRRPGRRTVARRRQVLPTAAPRPDVVAIAASTGGPAAVRAILGRLPADLRVPVLVALHLSAGFTGALAEALGRCGAVPVAEARDGDIPTPGRVYLAPGGRHLIVEQAPGGGRCIRVTDDPPLNDCRPSADLLFDSVADVYGPKSAGVILTGMGNDGVHGLRRIKARGGTVFAQDEESCAVFGMPSAAIRSGVVDMVARPEDIAARLVELVQRPA